MVPFPVSVVLNRSLLVVPSTCSPFSPVGLAGEREGEAAEIHLRRRAGPGRCSRAATGSRRIVESETIWAGPVRPGLMSGSIAASTVSSASSTGRLRRLKPGCVARPARGRGRPGCAGREADGTDLDPIGPADREVLDEEAAAGAGGRPPALAGGGVGDQHSRLPTAALSAAGDGALHGRAGDALCVSRAAAARAGCSARSRTVRPAFGMLPLSIGFSCDQAWRRVLERRQRTPDLPHPRLEGGSASPRSAR